MLVLRAKSKEGFVGPEAVLAWREPGAFLILFTPVAFSGTVYSAHWRKEMLTTWLPVSSLARSSAPWGR